MMGEEQQAKFSKFNHCVGSCRLIAAETSGGVFHDNGRSDPYVLRAKERAKSKIKNRITDMNGKG